MAFKCLGAVFLVGVFAAALMDASPVPYFTVDIDGFPIEQSNPNLIGFNATDFNHEISNTPSTVGSGAGAGKATLGAVSFIKHWGQASNALFAAAVTGLHIKTLTLYFYGGEGPVGTFKLTLKDVMVVKVKRGAAVTGALDDPTELVSLSYSQLTWTDPWKTSASATVAALRKIL